MRRHGNGARAGSREASPAPPGPPTDGAQELFFTVRAFHVAADVGYDLDGHASSERSTDVCWPPRAEHAVADAKRGIDDAMSGIVAGLGVEASINGHAQSGVETLVFAIDGVGDGADYFPVSASVATGRCASGDTWPSGGDATFNHGWVADRVWVSGPGPTLDVPFLDDPAVCQIELIVPLRVSRPIVTLSLDPDADGVNHGVIAGTVGIAEMTAEWADTLANAGCGIAAADARDEVMRALSRSADLMADGSAGARKDCDAISFAIAIDAAPAKRGTGIAISNPRASCP